MQSKYAYILKCIQSTLAYKKIRNENKKRCLCYFISARVEHIKFYQYYFSLFGDSQLLA